MNAMLGQFYCDAMRRYLDNSAFYADAKQEWNQAKGTNWDSLTNAADLLAERTGYLSFLSGLRLGILLSGELDELMPTDF